MADPSDLSGPLLPAASGGPPKQLVVLLHGYGANAQDLVALGGEWRKQLPDAAFISLNAPHPAQGIPGGREWFRLATFSPEEIRSGLHAAAPAVNAYLDKAKAAFGLDDSAVALAGFSQGAMLALRVGLTLRRPIAGIVAYSGVMVEPPPERQAYPAVMLTHGAEDQLIPPMALYVAEKMLRDAGVTVESEMRPGLGHGIDAHQVARGGAFLTRAFAT